MPVKSLIKPVAAKQPAPAKTGKGKAIQRKVLPGLFVSSPVQRKQQPGSWVHQQPLKAIHAASLVQPKINVHAANDRFEKEADQVADKVIRNESVNTPRTVTPVTRGTQRKALSSRQNRSARAKEILQLKASLSKTYGAVPAPPSTGSCMATHLQCADSSPPALRHILQSRQQLQTVLSNQSARGSPLPAPTRAFMEGRMGADFSAVRIHTATESHEAAKALGARAFTNGAHIHFAQGQFNPHTPAGRHLLAHELTHTIQQGAAGNRIQRAAETSDPVSMPLQNAAERGPPHTSSTIQCSLLDEALPHLAELIKDLPLFTSLQEAKEWFKGKLSKFASYFPGYKAMTLVFGEDLITGVPVADRSGKAFISAALEFIPDGEKLNKKLDELGALEKAGTWIDDSIKAFKEKIQPIGSAFAKKWKELGLMTIIKQGPSEIIKGFGQLFESAIQVMYDFAVKAGTEFLRIVKEFLINQLVDFIKNHTNAYELLKVIIGHDPITGKEVKRNGTNILNALLEFGGEEGKEQRRQMQDTGTFQKAADWIDRGIYVFGNLYNSIQKGFSEIWDIVTIASLMDPVATFTKIYGIFAKPVADVLQFVKDALVAILGYIKEVLLKRLSAWAKGIRGYPLVTVLIGKDPFTDEQVLRNVPNIIRGFMSLMEGGEEQYRQMEESGAIGRATQRIEAAVARLNMTPATVLQLFIDLWNSFCFHDLSHPIEAFKRIMARFGEPIARLIAFIIEIIKIVIYVILQVMNFPFDLINNIITRAMEAAGNIKRDPIGFLKNLLRAIKQGFIQFFDNIGTHLLNGVVGWLMSELKEAKIPELKDFSLKGVISWILEVLGISMEAIWQKLAAHPRIGPERVAKIRSMINTLEGIWTFIKDVQERGMAAIWDKIAEQLSNLWNTVLDAVKNWIMEKIIAQVTAKLLSLLDPTGIMAVINSAIAIYKAVQSFIRYLRQMLEVINSFVNGVADIAAGNVSTAANYLERTMDRAMPIVIGFLANQVGLSGIGRRIGEMVTRAREMVDQALTWLVNKAVNTGFAILDKLMAMGKSAAGAVLGWLGLRKPFKTKSGETHNLYFEKRGSKSVLMVASNPRTLRDFVTTIRFPPNRPPSGDLALDRQLAIQYLERIEELTHTPPAGLTEAQRTREIELKMQVASESVARLMMVAGGTVRSSKPPVFAGTYGDFARGMRVEIVNRPATAGSDASATGGMWSKLIKRREIRPDGRSYYIRGHLLSQHLGGDGGIWTNLTPLTQAANQDHETRIENPLKTRVAANADHAFIYVVNPAYGRGVNSGALAQVAALTGLTAAQKQDMTDVIQTEQYVPTSLVCSIQEIDPLSGEEVNSDISGTHTIANPITQNVPGYVIQPKFKMDSGAADTYEQEADQVADRVTGPAAKSAPVRISRLTTGIQHKPGDNKKVLVTSAANQPLQKLQQQPGQGASLPPPVKKLMEQKIGADFSNVRIHTSPDSHKANEAMGSKAFAQGADIHFANGEFNPGSKAGAHLLAHELVHTVQQGASAQKPAALAEDKQTKTGSSTTTRDKTPAAPKLKTGTNAEEEIKTMAAPAGHRTPVQTKAGEKQKAKTGSAALSGTSLSLPVKTTVSTGAKSPPKPITGLPAAGNKTPVINETRPLSSISAFTPTQLGKGFLETQGKTSAAVTRLSKERIENLPKVPLANGSAYGNPVLKHAKAYKAGASARQIDGLNGKAGFLAPQLPETRIPGELMFTPVSLPVSTGAEKDEVDAVKASETLDNVTLDTEGIPEQYEENPQVELKEDADPANMDTAMDEQSRDLNKEKNEAAKEIQLDYGENNVIRKPGKGTINAKKKVNPLKPVIRPLAKINSYPDYFEARAANYTGGNPYAQMDAETGKYYDAKQAEEDRMDAEDGKARQQIEIKSELSKQTQTGAQKTVLIEVNDQRRQWGVELDQTEMQFSTSAISLKGEYNESIRNEKMKGDTEIQSKIGAANKEAKDEHDKAKEEVEKEKQKKKKESSGFWGWLRSKAAALIDAIKSFVNKVFNALRKAVKWIFDKLKQAIVALLEMVHKLVVGLIKGFGMALKGLVSIALAAFPETRKKVVGAIDSAVDYAVAKTDQAFATFENAVSAIIDFVAEVVDTSLAIVQKITNIAFDVLKAIVVGLLYVLEYLLNLEKLYKLYRKIVDGFNYIWDHPEVVEQKAREFLEPHVLDTYKEAPAQVSKALNRFGMNIVKHVSGVMSYLKPNLEKLKSTWWQQAKDMIWYMIWPFADGSPLWTDAPKLWRLIPQIWNDFWSGEFSRCIDGCLEWMQALNSVLGAFALWIVIGCVVVGAIIGAFFGGAGAIPGAGAGLEAGIAIGEGIMVSMIATETIVIGKAVIDLVVTTDDGQVTTPEAEKAAAELLAENSTGQPESNGPTMRESGDVKTGRDRIEYAYQRIANSGLALGIMIALMLLGAIGGKIAQAIAAGIKKLAGIVGELAPGLSEGLGKLGTSLKESKVGSTLSKASEDFNAGRADMKAKIDSAKASVGLGKAEKTNSAPKADDKLPGGKSEAAGKTTEQAKTGEPTPEKPMIHEGGEKIVSADKSIDGKRKLEITEEGRCKVCSSPCDDIVEKYKAEINENGQIKSKLDSLADDYKNNRISLEDLKKELKKIDGQLNRIKQVKAATQLVGENGRFTDPALEDRYQQYVKRKQATSSPVRDRADWKVESDFWTKESPVARGNEFNRKAVKEQWYDYNEVHLKNGNRLDSYSTQNGGEIVSRKATNLGEIDQSTFEGYLDELNEKYKRGTEIRSNKYPELDGKKLEGTKYLEVPESNRLVPDIDKLIKLARKRGIEIRFRPFDL